MLWRHFVCMTFFLIIFNFIYRHSCIIYLQGIRPLGVIALLLMFVVFHLGSLNWQNFIPFVPWAIVAAGMWQDLVICKPLSQIWLSRFTYKVTSYGDFAPYMQSFRKFEACSINSTNDLNWILLILWLSSEKQMLLNSFINPFIQVIITVQKHIDAGF